MEHGAFLKLNALKTSDVHIVYAHAVLYIQIMELVDQCCKKTVDFIFHNQHPVVDPWGGGG